MLPAAPFLVDFDARDVPLGVVEEAARQAAAVSAEVQWGERLEEARAQGYEEGRAAAEAEAVARLEEARAEMAQSLAAAREAWCGEQGPQLAAHLATAVRDMQERIAHSAERVLRPFLAQAVREHAIGELRVLLQELLQTSPGLSLEISGPEDLLEALRAGLATSVAAVSYVANEAIDVQVKAGASIIETRIAAWLRDSAGQTA